MARRPTRRPPAGPPTAPFHAPFREAAGRLRRAAPAKPPPRSPAGAPPAGAPAAPAEARPPAPGGSDEDEFLAAVAGARPLGRDRRGRVLSAPAAPTARAPRREPAVAVAAGEAEGDALLADLCAGAGRLEVVASADRVEGLAPGLDRRVLRRLRRGEYALEGELDLHGLTQAEALSALARFLAGGRAEGRRCLRVIHGRGLHSPGGGAVLKERVADWLSRGPLAAGILAFATAQPQDGGAGALYVLLRR